MYSFGIPSFSDSSNNSFTISETRRFRSTCSPSFKTVPAISPSSLGNPFFGSFKFIPIPTTTSSISPVSKSLTASVKIPQTFFSPRYKSFTHLIPRDTLHTFSTALQTATAAAAVIFKLSCAVFFGFNKTLM